MRTLLPTLLRSGAALLLVSGLQAGDWIRVRSADIELLTDASEKTARQTMERFARIRALLPHNATAVVPLRVYLFASEREYRAYAPAATASGFYQSGFDRDSIAMVAGPELARAAVHEFVHFVTNTRDSRQPIWLREGLAEFYSNAQFTRGGVRLGAPIREHLETLKNTPWLTPRELEVHHYEPVLYAQSWALVHMLRREPEFPAMVTDAMIEQLRRYVRSMKAETVKMPVLPALSLTVDRLRPLDALLVRGELALRTGHLAPAREIYAQAERLDPASAKVVAGLAALAEAEGDSARSKELFERSLAMDQRDASAWFQLALLTGDDAALRKAVELNPDLGEAQILLGNRAADEGDFERAIQHLERAVTLLPRKSYAWYSLAFARYKSGVLDGTRETLDLALQTATTPEQAAMAQALKEALGKEALGN